MKKKYISALCPSFYQVIIILFFSPILFGPFKCPNPETTDSLLRRSCFLSWPAMWNNKGRRVGIYRGDKIKDPREAPFLQSQSRMSAHELRESTNFGLNHLQEGGKLLQPQLA